MIITTCIPAMEEMRAALMAAALLVRPCMAAPAVAAARSGDQAWVATGFRDGLTVKAVGRRRARPRVARAARVACHFSKPMSRAAAAGRTGEAPDKVLIAHLEGVVAVGILEEEVVVGTLVVPVVEAART